MRTAALQSVPEAIAAGDLIQRLAALGVDELRAWLGRLEDAEAVSRAVLREKLKLQRRAAADATIPADSERRG